MSSLKIDSAIVFADKNGQFAQVANEALKSLSFQKIRFLTDVNEVCQAAKTSSPNIFIINDESYMPVEIALRMLITNPIISVSPICLCIQSNVTKKYLQSVGRPFILKENTSPGAIKKGIKTLQNVWSAGNYASLCEISMLLGKDDTSDGINKIKTLISNPDIQPIVTPAFSKFLQSSDNYQIAEKILLQAIRNSPSDFGLLLALCDLYIGGANPAMALKLIERTETNQGKKEIFVLDKIKCNLMLNDISKALDGLGDLECAGVFMPIIKDHTARMFYSLGSDDVHQVSVASSPYLEQWQSRFGVVVPDKAG